MDSKELKNILNFFQKPLDKFRKIVYNLYRCHEESPSASDGGLTNARVAELADAHV